MNARFRIGIDPGWGDTFETLLSGFVRELFDTRKDIDWEIMPAVSGRPARAEVIDQYDGVLALGMPFDADSFAGVNRLTCISRWGVGFDAIDMAAASAAGVLVSLTPDAITRAVAEGQIALIFALAKRVPDLDRRTRSGLWRLGMPVLGVDVAGKTLSSIGLGRIAVEMFKIARGIGFGRLLACDPYCSPSRAEEAGVELVDLRTVMAEGDFVTVNTFLNASTRGMVGAFEFSLMKPTAYFVNTARGPDRPGDRFGGCTAVQPHRRRGHRCLRAGAHCPGQSLAFDG